MRTVPSEEGEDEYRLGTFEKGKSLSQRKVRQQRLSFGSFFVCAACALG
jgi:hypothetical protein